MAPEAELILEMYKVQVSRSEHFDNLREKVSSLVVALVAGVLAIAGFGDQAPHAGLLSGWLLIALGAFGYAASRRHGSRSRRHGKRAAEYRMQLNDLCPEARINEARDRVPRTPTYLYRIWSDIHLAIVIIGIASIYLGGGVSMETWYAVALFVSGLLVGYGAARISNLKDQVKQLRSDLKNAEKQISASGAGSGKTE